MRQASAPLTDEDLFVWAWINAGLWNRPSDSAMAADRRSAELMLYLRTVYEDVRPGTKGRYRAVWRSACAFQGISIL